MSSSNETKGLVIGNIAPEIDTKDINGNEISLTGILKERNGVVLDFFRGTW